MAYSPDYHLCDYPDSVPDCKGKSETVVGFKCPSPDELPPNAVARKFLPYPRFPLPGTIMSKRKYNSTLITAFFRCECIIFKLISPVSFLLGDDYAYIVCVGYDPRIQYCGEGTVFDPQVLTCVYAGPPHGVPSGPGFGPF